MKVGKSGILYPAFVEPNGKLRDKVRGSIQVHPEGYCYIEWRHNGKKREKATDRTEVRDRARRKVIEIHANRAGIETARGSGPVKSCAWRDRCRLHPYIKDMKPPWREPKTHVAHKYRREQPGELEPQEEVGGVRRNLIA